MEEGRYTEEELLKTSGIYSEELRSRTLETMRRRRLARDRGTVTEVATAQASTEEDGQQTREE